MYTGKAFYIAIASFKLFIYYCINSKLASKNSLINKLKKINQNQSQTSHIIKDII